jgi:UDP-N-acetylmuramate-alanine ligase
VKLQKDLRPGDVVLTLGAGDVWKYGEQLLAMTKESELPHR